VLVTHDPAGDAAPVFEEPHPTPAGLLARIGPLPVQVR